MKAKLILLAEPILVSDEPIEDGDWRYNPLSDSLTNEVNGNEVFMMRTRGTDWRKVIAGIPELPSIDFSALSEEDCKKIGWVDVEKLAQSFIIKNHLDSHSDMFYQETFIEGFKACQSLNEKKFSKEKIKPLQELLDEGYDAYDQYHHLQVQRMLKVIETFIQSVSQPKEVDVEVEMEQILANGADHDGQQCEYTMCYSSDHKVKDKCLGWCKDQPKITNNSIKVTKVL